MARLKRAFRHLATTAASGRAAFPATTLKAIESAIAEGERLHRAEVRLIVEAAMDVDDAWRGVTCRQRALALFAEHGIWDTEENCGVLVYINLAEHQVDIVADRNIDRRVDAAQWQQICSLMTGGFATGAYHDSTLAAIAALNALLQQHFPADGDRPNQLPNDAIVL
jgi:uncharacterized membrane protein